MSSSTEREHTLIQVQPPQDPIISQRFCVADSDIIIQSSDGVLFRLHQVNLKISLGSWKFGAADSEVVRLIETSAVLDLLFQFCYPERYPDLEDLDFDILANLSEAVEKYKVFSAIDVCKIAMRDKLPLNAFDILIYGATHAHPDVYQKAAPLVVLQKPMSEILPRLPRDLLVPWVLYHEKWLHVAQNAVSYHDIWARDHPPQSSDSHQQGNYTSGLFGGLSVGSHNYPSVPLLRRLGAGLECYTNIDTLFGSSPKGTFSSWRRSVEESIANIPPFNGPSVPYTDPATPSVPTIITCDNEAISARFCAPDSDVVFSSSDGMHFHIHKANLKTSAGGFAPPEFESQGKTTHLTETALTLEFLFQFCYPDCHPDVENLEFSEFAMLAEAAEKYQVYSAMNICKIRMKKLLPNHAIDILAYAARHDYPGILAIAAPIVLRETRLSEMLPRLPPHFVMRWVKYFETARPRSPFPLDNLDRWGIEEPAIAVP